MPPSDLHNFSDLQKMIQQNVTLSQCWVIRKNELRHQLVIGFYLSILEQSDSIRILAHEGKTHDACIILRSSFEHMLALAHVVSDEASEHQYARNFTQKGTLQLENALAGNPYLEGIARLNGIESDLEESKRRLSSYKAEKIHGPPSFEKIARDHNFIDLYDSIYRDLSDTVHPTYSGVIGRCFIVNPEQTDHEIVAFQRPKQIRIDLVVDTISRVLVQAHSCAEIFFNSQTAPK